MVQVRIITHRRAKIFYINHGEQIVPVYMKGCICHFAKWHIHPFIYKGRNGIYQLEIIMGGAPRVVVSTAAFHARVRGSVPGFGGLTETKMFLPHQRVKVSIVGSLRDREVACSASDGQGSNFESCISRTVSSHYPQEVLLAQFSLYVHKGGLKPDSVHLTATQHHCGTKRCSCI